MQDRQDARTPTTMSGSAALARAYWMLLGNVPLMFLVVMIGSRKFASPLIPSIAYFLVVLSVIIVRYADIRYWNGTTADDQPATMAHWRRHAVILISLSSCAWVIAFLIGQHPN